MTYNYAPRPRRRTGRAIALAVGAALCLLFALVVLGTVASAGKTSGSPARTPSPSPFPTAHATTATKPKAPPAKPVTVATIDGDDLVHVGEDVPAGTYRAAEKITPGCYWQKTTDAEGGHIIANDIPNGGRPQVTLKAGQWFSSQDCPTWVKK